MWRRTSGGQQENDMKVDTFEKLYRDQLATVRKGGEELLDLLPQLLSVITHQELRNEVRDLMPSVREQIGRIEQVMPDDGVTQQADESPGMRGLIDECHTFLERASDPDIIDAGLVVCVQKILHVMMTGHASLRVFARFLGRTEEVEAFQRSLDEQVDAENSLVQLALDVIHVDALNAGRTRAA